MSKVAQPIDDRPGTQPYLPAGARLPDTQQLCSLLRTHLPDRPGVPGYAGARRPQKCIIHARIKTAAQIQKASGLLYGE